MHEDSCCGGAAAQNLPYEAWPCANEVRKAVDMALTYIGESEKIGKERFLERVKKDIESEAKLNCSDDACEKGEAKCTFDYEIGEIRVTTLVKPGGKTQLHGKPVDEGCWRFEATILCGCWCVSLV